MIAVAKCSLMRHALPARIQFWAFMLLAVLGGYLGSLFTAFNTWVCVLRKRWSRWFSFRVLEVGGAHRRARHRIARPLV